MAKKPITSSTKTIKVHYARTAGSEFTEDHHDHIPVSGQDLIARAIENDGRTDQMPIKPSDRPRPKRG